jgi:Fe-S cluster assembly ATP-binding protein
MLEIKNLHASIDGTEILKGIDLVVNAGEVHAIMGPNGSGKSTFSQVLAGRDLYEVTEGEILFEGRNIMDLAPEERAADGIFMAFQYPVEIPGVRNNYFLKTALNSIRKHRGEPELDAMDFLGLLKEKMKELRIAEGFANRAVNDGFSGGEKKRNEILQMALLDPKVAILDETDSGLDIDALKIVSEGVNALRGPNRGIVIITHYQRLLNYIIPDIVHVMIDGKIIKTGDKELALELEREGYGEVNGENGQAAKGAAR